MIIQYSTCSFSFTYIHCTVHVYAYLATYKLVVHLCLTYGEWWSPWHCLPWCNVHYSNWNKSHNNHYWNGQCTSIGWIPHSVCVWRSGEPHLRAMQSHFPSFLLVRLKTLVVLNVPWLGLVFYANSVCSLWAPPTCSSGGLNTCTSVGGSVWMYINVHSYTHLFEFVFYTGEPAPATRNM